MAFAGIPQAQAAGDDAGQILKAMSDYLAAQKIISLTFDSDIEVITPDLEKIQFTNSGTLLLHRPNEIRVTRTGGYADVELFFDGKALTVVGKNINSYTQLDAPGSVDQLIDTLRGRGMAPPGADLLLGNVHDTLSATSINHYHLCAVIPTTASASFRQSQVEIKDAEPKMRATGPGGRPGHEAVAAFLVPCRRCRLHANPPARGPGGRGKRFRSCPNSYQRASRPAAAFLGPYPPVSKTKTTSAIGELSTIRFPSAKYCRIEH
jgi:hypothetical protein